MISIKTHAMHEIIIYLFKCAAFEILKIHKIQFYAGHLGGGKIIFNFKSLL